MIETGLVSITFRQLNVEEVIRATVEAGLQGIEWGSDVHVPVGDLEHARKTRELTEAAGLKVFSYGSYYRAGDNGDPQKDFAPVLETACALGAPVIRVWAGSKWSWKAGEAYWDKVVEDSRIIGDMAAEKGIKICFEYHGWTLTDNRFSAQELSINVGRENVRLYWQPNFCLTTEENLLALDMLLPRVENIHCFFWNARGERFPLAQGSECWEKFAQLIKADGGDHRLMVEFVKDATPEQLLQDAEALRRAIS